MGSKKERVPDSVLTEDVSDLFNALKLLRGCRRHNGEYLRLQLLHVIDSGHWMDRGFARTRKEMDFLGWDPAMEKCPRCSALFMFSAALSRVMQDWGPRTNCTKRRIRRTVATVTQLG